MAKSHPRWRVAKKILTWLFFIAVIVLLLSTPGKSTGRMYGRLFAIITGWYY